VDAWSSRHAASGPPQQWFEPPVPFWYSPHRPLQHSSADAHADVVGLQQRPASHRFPAQHSIVL